MTNRFYFGNILIDNMKTCPKCQGEMEQTGEKEFWDVTLRRLSRPPPQGRHVVVLVGENLGY